MGSSRGPLTLFELPGAARAPKNNFSLVKKILIKNKKVKQMQMKLVRMDLVPRRVKKWLRKIKVVGEL